METNEGWPAGTVVRRCPWCANFEVPDPPPMLECEGDLRADDRITVRITRKAWEIPMIEHLRTDHPERFAELAVQLITDMDRDLQAAASLVRKTLERAPLSRDVNLEIGVREPPPIERFKPSPIDPTFEDFMRGWSGL